MNTYFRLVAVLLGVTVHASTSPALAQQAGEPTQRTLVHGPLVGGGLLTANKLGPGLMGGWRVEFPFGRWLYVSTSPTLSYVFNSNTHTLWMGSDAIESPNTDKQRILALSVDSFVGINVVESVALEVGGDLGIASNAAQSTFCGKETYAAGFVGLEGGLAFRAGASRQFLASVHAVAVTLPVLRCSYYSSPQPWREPAGVRMYHERDFETLGALLRLGFTL